MFRGQTDSILKRLALIFMIVALGAFAVACAEPGEEAAEPGAEPGVEEPLETPAAELGEEGEELGEEAEETGEELEEEAEEPLEEGEAAGPTLGDITESPEQHIGQQVTVEGTVNVVLSEQAFTIADNTLVDENEVLVLNTTGGPVAGEGEAEQQPVRVTGTVVQFVQADIEQQYGLDLDEQLVVEFEGKPAIVAQSVESLEGDTES